VKTILSNQRSNSPENGDIAQKGHRKGARAAPQRGFNHISKKKKRLWVDKWWRNRKELAMVCTVCCHMWNVREGVTRASVTREVWVLTSPSPLHFGRMGLWVKYEISWVRNTSAVFESGTAC
uniref:Uncharacterized protein n=1 Tax=Sus scrofa TaxID=9823 RepID=A0A8D1IIH6_PIG